MAVYFHALNISLPLLNKSRTSRWIRLVIDREKKICRPVHIIFTNDQTLLGINRQFLDHHDYTDVISFPYGEGKNISGDIFISLERVQENAVRYRCSFEEELRRVMVHGLLHLAGYDDQTASARKAMTRLEDHYLKIYSENL